MSHCHIQCIWLIYFSCFLWCFFFDSLIIFSYVGPPYLGMKLHHRYTAKIMVLMKKEPLICAFLILFFYFLIILLHRGLQIGNRFTEVENWDLKGGRAEGQRAEVLSFCFNYLINLLYRQTLHALQIITRSFETWCA